MVGIDTLTAMAGHLLGRGRKRRGGAERGGGRLRRPGDTARWPAGRSRHGVARRAAPSGPCRENACPHDIHPGPAPKPLPSAETGGPLAKTGQVVPVTQQGPPPPGGVTTGPRVIRRTAALLPRRPLGPVPLD